MRIFDFVPFYTYESIKGYRVLTTEMESGKEYRYYKGRKPREWNLTFVGNVTEMKPIEDFFDSVKGPFTSFRWTPPNECKSVVVRFKDETLESESEGILYKTLKFTLKEVL